LTTLKNPAVAEWQASRRNHALRNYGIDVLRKTERDKWLHGRDRKINASPNQRHARKTGNAGALTFQSASGELCVKTTLLAATPGTSPMTWPVIVSTDGVGMVCWDGQIASAGSAHLSKFAFGALLFAFISNNASGEDLSERL
jgi:hypothetical protein